MAVQNLTSQIVEIEGFNFLNVTDEAVDLFIKGLDLYEITEENDLKTEHLIKYIGDLYMLLNKGICIFKEEIK